MADPNSPILQSLIAHDAKQGSVRASLHDLVAQAGSIVGPLLKARSASVPRRQRVHTDFDAVFTDGQEFIGDERGRFKVRCIDTTDLVLPTGRIVVCDPALGDDSPLARQVPPGRYPVRISLYDDDPAAVMVRFSESSPVRWEMALWQGQSESQLQPNEIFGFGVDTATGCFVDASIVGKLADAEVQVEELWESRTLDERTSANVVAYLTRADGRYVSYWGLDDAGDPACLVTEISSFVADERAGTVVDNILERPPGEVPHSFLDAFGLWLEVAHIGKDKQHLVVALFGPGARRAAIELVDEGWNRCTKHRHIIGGDCMGVGGQYVQWEVDKATAGGTALQMWVTIGSRRFATVAPEEPPETGTYAMLDS